MKQFIAAALVLFMAIAVSAEEKKKKEDPLKDIFIVKKKEPVAKDRLAGYKSIKSRDAGAYVRFLSSDMLEGRDTGTRGYKIAAEYAASLFEMWGLKPAGDMPKTRRRSFFDRSSQSSGKVKRTYLQNVDFKQILKTETSMSVSHSKSGSETSRTYKENIDYTYFAQNSHTMKAKLVFAGYGISEKKAGYDDYKKLDVRGKIVMILDGVPDIKLFEKGKLRNKYMGRSRHMRRSVSAKVKTAVAKGAIAMVLVSDQNFIRRSLDRKLIYDDKPVIPGRSRRVRLAKSSMKMPWQTIPTIRVTEKVADEILKNSGKSLKKISAAIKKDKKSPAMVLAGTWLKVEAKVEEKPLGCYNVLAYIEGSDPELKNEVVMLGAHLDHLGKRGDYIFNGADDNGSGSAAVLEIAQAFAANKIKPKRTVMFALWTGEEKGLLGSRFYVENPYFPLKKTISYLNLDMISRPWTKKRLEQVAQWWKINIPEKLMKDLDASRFLSLSLSATDPLYKSLIKNNKHVGLTLHLRKSKRVMGGSDHAPFAYHKVPWIFFFASMTKDYHQPTDSMEKMDMRLLKSIARLAYLTAFDMANN